MAFGIAVFLIASIIVAVIEIKLEKNQTNTFLGMIIIIIVAIILVGLIILLARVLT